MNVLQIRLLGDFALAYGGDLLTAVDSPRLQSAFAFLLLHSRAPQLRRHMAFQLWPDSTERQAHNNLRKVLHQLRRALSQIATGQEHTADHWLHIDARTVHWRPDVSCTIDVLVFETKVRLTEDAADDPAEEQRRLAEAIALYRGGLLPSCYDEWIVPHRERLRQHLIEALERLIWLAEDGRDYPTAIHHAQQLLHHDPLHEATYRRLMRLHMLAGNRAGALHAYHTCAVLLQRELGVEPALETQQAHAQLLEMEIPPVLRSQPPRAEASILRLAGRQTEWRTLRAAWQRAARGQLHFVLISGEAGIGKTRLAEELLTWTERQGMAAARTRAYAAGQGLAYTPVIEWLQSQPLQAPLRDLDEHRLVEVARLVPDLLAARPNLAAAAPPPTAELTQWQRQQLFAALAHLFLDNCEPKLLLIDDLQWCDGETLAWLRYLFSIVQSGNTPHNLRTRTLIVGTVRPEEVDADHPLTALLLDLRSANQVTEIGLTPLTQTETAEIAAQVSDSILDNAALQQLFAQSEGNPLFIVEMMRAGFSAASEDGDSTSWPQQEANPQSAPGLLAPLSTGVLPSKVLAVVQSRLVQLSTGARQLASIAAVIGRSFTFELLQAVSEENESTLVNQLDELWQRGIVRTYGGQTYDFGHDRIREVAYGEISPVQRPVMHKRVAAALEQLYTDDLGSWSMQLAMHYECAGLVEKAIFYLEQAAEIAHNLFACSDAIELLHRALALLETLPATRRTKEKELSLLLQLAQPLGVAQGFLALELFTNAQRAIQLAKEVGSVRQRIRTFMSLQSTLFLRAQFAQVLSISDQLGALMQERQSHAELADEVRRPLVAETHRTRGNVYWLTGQLDAAQTEFDLTLSLKNDTVNLCSFSALNLWLLGYPDYARKRIYQGLQIASVHEHPMDVAFVMANLARLNYFLGRLSNMKRWADKTVTHCETYQIPFWLAIGRLFQGLGLAADGHMQQGVDQLRVMLDRQKAEGHITFRTHFLGLLAEAYAISNQFQAALTTLDEAIALAERTGEKFWYPELIRLRGKCLLAQKCADVDVESCYQQAIASARQQNAKSLELRATLSLAHLWRRQHRAAEAHTHLSIIYNWFTEGFQTPDLQAARELLSGLSPSTL